MPLETEDLSLASDPGGQTEMTTSEPCRVSKAQPPLCVCLLLVQVSLRQQFAQEPRCCMQETGMLEMSSCHSPAPRCRTQSMLVAELNRTFQAGKGRMTILTDWVNEAKSGYITFPAHQHHHHHHCRMHPLPAVGSQSCSISSLPILPPPVLLQDRALCFSLIRLPSSLFLAYSRCSAKCLFSL